MPYLVAWSGLIITNTGGGNVYTFTDGSEGEGVYVVWVCLSKMNVLYSLYISILKLNSDEMIVYLALPY